jgi:hypothetical protein
MEPVLHRWLIVAVVLVGNVAVAVPSTGRVEARAAQAAQAPAERPALSLAEKEEFLAKARIVRTRSVSVGVTGTLRATLTDGRITHDASIQTIDEYKSRFEGLRGVELDFKDSWKYNVAAYRLDRLLELGMVPPSVERRYDRGPAAFTWWVDDVLMDEGARLKKKIPVPDVRRWNEQMWHVRLFDQLIDNVDRNLGNLLIDTDWRIWMIDHSRAFRLLESPRAKANISQCDRVVLERLKALDLETVTKATRGYLTGPEIKAMLKRRDAIVQLLESSNGIFEWERPERN